MSRIMAFLHFYKTNTLLIAAKIYTQHSLIIFRLSDIPRQYLLAQITIISFPCFYSIVTAIYTGYTLPFPPYIHTYHNHTRTAALLHPNHSHNYSLYLSSYLSTLLFFPVSDFLSFHINQLVILVRVAIGSVGVLGGVEVEALRGLSEFGWHIFGPLVFLVNVFDVYI